jgi:site-specific DNA-cytosine methylase
VANGVPNKLYGGRINEQNSSEKGSTESSPDYEEMRDVRSGRCEDEPAPLRLLRLYGRENSLHEMPCKGSCKTSSYCNLCYLWENLCSQRPQEKSENMQQGMPCRVWEAMRLKTMESQWRTEPSIPRVANGIKNRVDRLKCLGNAVVPQQAYPIFQAIADIESGVVE